MFYRSSPKAASAVRAHLSLESLGNREVPAQIVSFSGNYMGDGIYMLTGTVTDSVPVEGREITFSGSSAVEDLRVEVLADGSFSTYVYVDPITTASVYANIDGDSMYVLLEAT